MGKLGRWPDPPAVDEHPTEIQLDEHTLNESVGVGGALLLSLRGEDAGRVELIGPGGGAIGRGHGVDVSFDDSSVSRAHARFERLDEGYRLVDLGSVNGTYVNGRRILAGVDLPASCRIRFGAGTVLQYSVVDATVVLAIGALRRSSQIDPLTGVGKREFFEQRLAEEVAFARRHETNVGLMIFDVDRFKDVNDQYGHPAGDLVLQEFAASLTRGVRAEDCVFRYGGDEFCILLRDQPLSSTLTVAERIRASVEQTVVHIDGVDLRVTTSVGVAVLRLGASDLQETLDSCLEESTDELLCDDQPEIVALADQALLTAKREGRNRVFALWE